MSYATINQCANDYAFRARVTGCYAQEGVAAPDQKAVDMMWKLAVDANIEAAYEGAVTANNPNPGGDETVITDPMIYAACEAADAASP